MNLQSSTLLRGTSARSMNILGIQVANPDQREAIDMLASAITEKRFTKVAFLNAHSANTTVDDPEFASILSSFLVLPDGIGVDMGAKILYGAPFRENLNGTDFVPAVLASIQSPLTVGIIGAIRENGERATQDLRESMPQHRFVYLNDGYLDPQEESVVIQQISDLKPDVLLVAMGVPRQEKWIDANLSGQDCTVPIAVGALLDFLSGAVSRAPRIMRRLRIEWVYRLYREPGRLWRRYILGNPVFLMRIAMQKFSTGKGGTDDNA